VCLCGEQAFVDEGKRLLDWTWLLEVDFQDCQGEEECDVEIAVRIV
jgi:hypothetical protein